MVYWPTFGWLFMVNVGEHTIHGSYEIDIKVIWFSQTFRHVFGIHDEWDPCWEVSPAFSDIETEKFTVYMQSKNKIHVKSDVLLGRVVIMWYTLDLPSTCHPGFQLQIKIYRNSTIPKKHPSPDGDFFSSWGYGGIDLPFRIFFRGPTPIIEMGWSGP